ncbi:hypothetical protein QYM36_012920, partial [Artemia franciscana]
EIEQGIIFLMGEVKAFLFKQCQKQKWEKPEIEFKLTGPKSVLCELKTSDFPYVATGNGSNKKEAEADACQEFVKYLVSQGKINPEKYPRGTKALLFAFPGYRPKRHYNKPALTSEPTGESNQPVPVSIVDGFKLNGSMYPEVLESEATMLPLKMEPENDNIQAEITVPTKKAERLERKRKKVESLLGCITTSSENTFEGNNKNEVSMEVEEGPPPKKERLTLEEFEELKKKLHARKKILTTIPLFKFSSLGTAASLENPSSSRQPIIATDVQTLLLYAAAGDKATYQPYRWCTLQKWNHLSHVVCLVFEGLTVEDYENNLECFKNSKDIFTHGVEMATSASDDLSLAEDLSYVSLTKGHMERIKHRHKSFTNALKKGVIYQVLPDSKEESNNEKTVSSCVISEKEELNIKVDGIECVVNVEEKVVQTEEVTNGVDTKSLASFPISHEKVPERPPVKDKFSRLKLLLSTELLVGERYPLPGIQKYAEYKMTKDLYVPVTSNSPMYSVDCEWVTCVGNVNGLARVAVVDEELKVFYHSLVKPSLPIVNYNTRYSGITKALLQDVKKTAAEVQEELINILPPDAILIGQSLGGDLAAMKLMHPYVIDTSVIFNLTGQRQRKSKLSLMSQIFLGEKIQCHTSGHDPIEDSIAAMKLVLLKLQMNYSYGDVVLGGYVPKTYRDREPVFQRRELPIPLQQAGQDNVSRPPLPDDSLNLTCLYSKLLSFYESCDKSLLKRHNEIGEEFLKSSTLRTKKLHVAHQPQVADCCA